jgi:hypothetical protein
VDVANSRLELSRQFNATLTNRRVAPLTCRKHSLAC